MSGRHWSLRRLLAAVLGMLGVLVGALFLVTSLQIGAARDQTHAEDRRTASFLVADSLRQSSNDLTNMVRLYVATGDPRYREYYNEILAVRAGSAPRPLGYDSSFWDRVLAKGKRFVRYGRPESLIAEMRAQEFTGPELRALTAALDASNGLARRERAVMAEVAPRVRRGVDASYSQDVSDAFQRLVDREYLADKGSIMLAIRRFTAMVDARTLRSVRDTGDDIQRLALIEAGIIVLIAVVGILAMLLLSRVALPARAAHRLDAAHRGR